MSKKMEKDNLKRTSISRIIKYCDRCKHISSVRVRPCPETPTPSICTVKESDGTDNIHSKENNTTPSQTIFGNNNPFSQLENNLDHCPYKKQCYHCKNLIQKVRSLLDEVQVIRKGNFSGVCIHCKRSNKFGKCLRCEMIFNNKKEDDSKDEAQKQRSYKIWICKIKQLLYSLLERETCRQNVFRRNIDSTDELTNLLRKLKSPLNVSEPYIGYFLTIDSLEHVVESKQILDQVLEKLERPQEHALKTSPSKFCICKFLSDRKTGEKFQKIQLKENLMYAELPTKGAASLSVKAESPKVSAVSPKVGIVSPKVNYVSPKVGAVSPKVGTASPKVNSGSPKVDATLLKMGVQKVPPLSLEDKAKIDLKKKGIKPSRSCSHTKKKASKVDKSSEKVINLKKNIIKRDQIKDLSKKTIVENKLEIPGNVNGKHNNVKNDLADSDIACEGQYTSPRDMIKGNKIVPIRPRLETNTRSIEPILFKVAHEYRNQVQLDEQMKVNTFSPNNNKKTDEVTTSRKGIIKYMLSNVEFIEKGWTQLPTIKVIRRMNIYKMLPMDDNSNWLVHTCKNQAEIEENGNGKIFYKNGRIAMMYFNNPDANDGHRCIVYSDGEKDVSGRKLPLTILAAFDYRGNGVVFDHYGNERIKYNQSEGVVIDSKIGNPSHWRWHSLNDPPVLQQQHVETTIYNPYIQEDIESNIVEKGSSSNLERVSNLEMVTIELDNFLKHKAMKLLQKFKPFYNRTKMLKINNQFALRILNQTHIYLFFRDGTTSVKLNLGLHLVSRQIIGTVTSDASEVATRYDQKPTKSKLTAIIHKTIENTRKLSRLH